MVFDKIWGFAKDSIFPALGKGVGEEIAKQGVNMGFDQFKEGPMSAVDRGNFDRQYGETRFPGTNPWERLGVQGQSGPMEVAKQTGRNAEKLQRAQGITQNSVSQRQFDAAKYSADSNVKVAKIKATADAYKMSGELGSQNLNKIISGITGDTRERPMLEGKSTQMQQAEAAVKQAANNATANQIRSEELALKDKHYDLELASKTPMTMALGKLAATIHKEGHRTDVDNFLMEHLKGMQITGMTEQGLRSIANIVKGFLANIRVKKVTKDKSQVPIPGAKKSR